MIDHVSVGVGDLERAGRFYELALAPLGLSRLVTRPATIGFGKSYPEFWINGTDSSECCAFSGGPFVESRYFGEGIGIAVRKGNDLLRQSLNWALFRLWEKGRYTDLWLRYFSISPF